MYEAMPGKLSRMGRWSSPVAICIAVLMSGLGFPAAIRAQAQAGPQSGTQSAAWEAAWRQELTDWRTEREHAVSAPDGWLTLSAMEWLKQGISSVGAAPDNQIKLPGLAPDHLGLLTISGKTVQLLAPAGGFPAELKIDGQPAREGPLSADDLHPSRMSWRGLSMVVLNRGGRFALRVKDADSMARAGFHGLNWYAPDPRFVVAAKWIPYTPQHIEKIPTVLGATLDLPTPGVAEFSLGGQTLRLTPVLEDPSGRTLFFILSDATGKTTTYGTARYLHTGLPDHGLAEPGVLVLDFNRLENPPCAYTPYATCPLPPAENRLPVALEAGEQRYAH